VVATAATIVDQLGVPRAAAPPHKTASAATHETADVAG
jgi:hypothetical protein